MSNFNQIVNNIKKNDVKDVYLLSGPEYFIVEQFKLALIDVVKEKI